MIYHDPEAQAEARHDHYDDQGEHDAATISAMSGYEAPATNEDLTVDAITARAGGELALKGMGEAFWQEQNQKGGFNYVEHVNNTPEQKAINQQGRDKLRQVIAEDRQRGK